MAEREPIFRRADLRGATRRDVARYERRARGTPFWRSLALIGSVGWPIATLSVAGAFVGRWCDQRLLGGGVRCSLGFLLLGTALGTRLAYRAAAGRRP
jgi:hypothetical protein